MKFRQIASSFAAMITILNVSYAQQKGNEVLPAKASLQQLIDYALNNRISLKQAIIDEEIGEKDIDIALSGWLPQIGATGSYNYNVKIPTSFIGGNNIALGQKNSSALVLQADQQILNPSLMQASKAAALVRESNKQNTESQKINTVVEVSKAYFDILTSEEQIKIVRENITRLQKQYNDAKVRYEVGMVDKTDFKRAQIALSNAHADEKRTIELQRYKYDYLKNILAVDQKANITLSFENASMENEILIDTTSTANMTNRIEFQQLQNSKKMQELETQYYKWTYLPNISAFYNYAFNYRNNTFKDLYSDNFPSSVAGLSVSIPIFQGFKRKNQIYQSKLRESKIDLSMANLNNQINTEYSLAKASYNANLIDWKTSKENVDLSKEVYDTIKLQYDEGIKTYLDLMTAETDLKTSQLNYLNALYALLSSKLDVQKALGTVNTK
ncbi:TolC family protein [Sphingobacterium sp. SRCM116780]|uniref:TolC family protein n=1 Tax=Sphingobacterium sp. SRCM116780 TaxID=2907623 RepID=UPI001F3535C8|nr:TolC family protein [Sphingobacterium sp. SRCM116780]UIR54521.1 TolC family protein [Sphingobacterium sp. SRCM116780]